MVTPGRVQGAREGQGAISHIGGLRPLLSVYAKKVRIYPIRSMTAICENGSLGSLASLRLPSLPGLPTAYRPPLHTQQLKGELRKWTI
jgi:hypothetical protein